MMETNEIRCIIQAILMAADAPVSVDKLHQILEGDHKPSLSQLRELLVEMSASYKDHAFELKEVASGWRFQTKSVYSSFVQKFLEERSPRYSRALLEILALIAYRQPITRAEIEEVRGVAVRSNIVKILSERGWIRIVGHRDVPGKPALYATTKEFLDYFNLKSLEELPVLSDDNQLDLVVNQLQLADVVSDVEDRSQPSNVLAENNKQALVDVQETHCSKKRAGDDKLSGPVEQSTEFVDVV